MAAGFFYNGQLELVVDAGGHRGVEGVARRDADLGPRWLREVELDDERLEHHVAEEQAGVRRRGRLHAWRLVDLLPPELVRDLEQMTVDRGSTSCVRCEALSVSGRACKGSLERAVSGRG
eukprot:1533582-Rhodomonas_salina.1